MVLDSTLQRAKEKGFAAMTKKTIRRQDWRGSTKQPPKFEKKRKISPIIFL